MYATQNEDYLQHLHKSSNQACGFILEFIEHVVETNIRSIWRFIMVNEPSLRRFKQCPDNHTVIEEISELRVNEKIIRESDFQELYQAIQFNLNSQATIEIL